MSLAYFASFGYCGAGPTRKNAPSRSAGSCPSTSQSNNSTSERLTPPPSLPPPPNARGSLGKRTAAKNGPRARVPATARPVRKHRRPRREPELLLLESELIQGALLETAAGQFVD